MDTSISKTAPRVPPTIPTFVGSNVMGGIVPPQGIDVSRFSRAKGAHKKLTAPDGTPISVDLRYVVATPERIAEAELLYYKIVKDDDGSTRTCKSGTTEDGVQRMILMGRDKSTTELSNIERAKVHKRRQLQISSGRTNDNLIQETTSNMVVESI